MQVNRLVNFCLCKSDHFGTVGQQRNLPSELPIRATATARAEPKPRLHEKPVGLNAILHPEEKAGSCWF